MRRGVVTWRTELKIRKMAEVQKGLDKGDKERRGKERRVRSSTEAEGQRLGRDRDGRPTHQKNVCDIALTRDWSYTSPSSPKTFPPSAFPGYFFLSFLSASLDFTGDDEVKAVTGEGRVSSFFSLEFFSSSSPSSGESVVALCWPSPRFRSCSAR